MAISLLLLHLISPLSLHHLGLCFGSLLVLHLLAMNFWRLTLAGSSAFVAKCHVVGQAVWQRRQFTATIAGGMRCGEERCQDTCASPWHHYTLVSSAKFSGCDVQDTCVVPSWLI